MGQQFDIEKAAILLAFVVAGTFIVRQASAARWKKISSREGGFACLMPASPKIDSQTIEVNGMKVQGKAFSAWNRANSEFTLAYFDTPGTLSQEETEKWLDRQGQMLTQGDESRMVFAQKLALKGYSGRHYTAHTENNTDADEMVYLVKRRLYFLIVVQDRGGGDQEDVKRFFESFTFEPN